MVNKNCLAGITLIFLAIGVAPLVYFGLSSSTKYNGDMKNWIFWNQEYPASGQEKFSKNNCVLLVYLKKELSVCFPEWQVTFNKGYWSNSITWLNDSYLYVPEDILGRFDVQVDSHGQVQVLYPYTSSVLADNNCLGMIVLSGKIEMLDGIPICAERYWYPVSDAYCNRTSIFVN